MGYQPGQQVSSQNFGVGQVLLDHGATVVVRFEGGIEELPATALTPIVGPWDAIRRPEWDSPLELVTRVQAEAIRSVNDSWGVPSRSRIALLPHQLWVCRRVLTDWPTRWLVADDVGLGKTIEAGLILWPLLSRGTVRRLLVLCPASLVEQWQQRLKDMFDIRLARYVPEADTPKSDFWHTHPLVVASFHTLRDDHKDRHKRMLEAPGWDLVVVDEAHHLNVEEHKSPTLGYQLIEKLGRAGRVQSMVFFTGTPHRGKNYGFLALLRLLRPDLFDVRRPLSDQLVHLRRVLIRNNKQNVTDLKGNRLFHAPQVRSETYRYSAPESQFYEKLTDFIVTGKAYASTLGGTESRTAMLVLIAMQKLASSSVAAIRRALKRRLARTRQVRQSLDRLQQQREDTRTYYELEAEGDSDELSRIEEQIAELAHDLKLMEDEEPRLEELVEAAERITAETKIDRILDLVQSEFAARSVLFFTEYKATQSLLMTALMQRYGDECVTFINGDGRAEEIIGRDGRVRTLQGTRENAAGRFNRGEVRFLVSTEAAGEGIDLQETAYTLIHVDLPWNPMRLHQRVGRLNRYGQTHPVDVVLLRNPETVESRIWDKLFSRINHIMSALGEAMDEPEDLMELVLGMTSPTMFRELFADAPGEVSGEALTKWFDRKTATFGGRDVLETVRDLVGHCARFDFQEVSSRIPRLDLPDLGPFLLGMLERNHRRVQQRDDGLAFKTPDAWLTGPAVRTSYQGLVFDRHHRGRDAARQVLGVGHPLIDAALQQARETSAAAATFPVASLQRPLTVFRIADRVTTGGGTVRVVVAGIEGDSPGNFQLLLDWQLLKLLNGILDQKRVRRAVRTESPDSQPRVISVAEEAHQSLNGRLSELDLPFQAPQSQLLAILWPQ